MSAGALSCAMCSGWIEPGTPLTYFLGPAGERLFYCNPVRDKGLGPGRTCAEVAAAHEHDHEPWQPCPDCGSTWPGAGYACRDCGHGGERDVCLTDEDRAALREAIANAGSTADD